METNSCSLLDNSKNEDERPKVPTLDSIVKISKLSDEEFQVYEEKAVSVSDPSAKYRKVQKERDSQLDLAISEIHNFETSPADDNSEMKRTPSFVNNNNRCRVDKAPIWIDLTQPELNCSVCGTPLGSEDAEWHLIKCTMRLSVE